MWSKQTCPKHKIKKYSSYDIRKIANIGNANLNFFTADLNPNQADASQISADSENEDSQNFEFSGSEINLDDVIFQAEKRKLRASSNSNIARLKKLHRSSATSSRAHAINARKPDKRVRIQKNSRAEQILISPAAKVKIKTRCSQNKEHLAYRRALLLKYKTSRQYLPFIKVKSQMAISTFNHTFNIKRWLNRSINTILWFTIFNFWMSLIMRYFSYEKYLMVDEEPVEKLLYPAITFCNNGKYFRPMGSIDVLRSWAIDSRLYNMEDETKNPGQHIIQLNNTWIHNSTFEDKHLNSDLAECLESHDNQTQAEQEDDHYHEKMAAKPEDIQKVKSRFKDGLPLDYYRNKYTKFMDTWGWKLLVHDNPTDSKGGGM